MFSSSAPFTQCVLEEIGLEGLEGITLEGLWKRLSVRLKLQLPLQSKFTENVWTFVKKSKEVQFFILPVEREPLKVFDRFANPDPVTGVPHEPVRREFPFNFSDSTLNAQSVLQETCPYNEYPFNPVTTDSARGSCEHFKTREEIAKKKIEPMSLGAAESEWGLRLVMVASQSVRDFLLFPETVESNVEVVISYYCILERLGRARANGEISNGRFSLNDIVGDPTNFHFIK